MDWINREIVMLAVYIVMILGIIAASYLIMSQSITRQSHQVLQGYEQPVSLTQWKAGVLKSSIIDHGHQTLNLSFYRNTICTTLCYLAFLYL